MAHASAKNRAVINMIVTITCAPLSSSSIELASADEHVPSAAR
jgi:hypothetical protein